MRGAKQFANLQRRQKIAPRERIFIFASPQWGEVE
jgi:hypothetical protein